MSGDKANCTGTSSLPRKSREPRDTLAPSEP